MKIEIRSHYWPATPAMREIKIVVDGEVMVSSFMNCDQVWDLAKKFRNFDHVLMDLGNTMHDELIDSQQEGLHENND